MEQRHVNFLLDSVEKMGAGKFFHQAIIDGIKSGVSEIPLATIVFNYDKATNERLEVTPRVIEKDPGSEFYVFKGYTGKLMQDGKEPKEHFFTSFQMSTFNVD